MEARITVAVDVEEDECSICLEPIEPACEARLACGHAFHKRCLAAWERNQILCLRRARCAICCASYGESPVPDEHIPEADVPRPYARREPRGGDAASGLLMLLFCVATLVTTVALLNRHH